MENLTDDQLEALITSNIYEIKSDSSKCEKYPNICTYSSSGIYLNKIVKRCFELIDKEGYSDVFKALGTVELELRG